MQKIIQEPKKLKEKSCHEAKKLEARQMRSDDAWMHHFAVCLPKMTFPMHISCYTKEEFKKKCRGEQCTCFWHDADVIAMPVDTQCLNRQVWEGAHLDICTVSKE